MIAERVSARPVEADSGSEALPPGADDDGQATKAASNPSWVDDWFAEEAKREEEGTSDTVGHSCALWL